jgi:hypothetical protein
MQRFWSVALAAAGRIGQVEEDEEGKVSEPQDAQAAEVIGAGDDLL